MSRSIATGCHDVVTTRNATGRAMAVADMSRPSGAEDANHEQDEDTTMATKTGTNGAGTETSPFMFGTDFTKMADFSKFADMSKMMGDVRFPMVDMEQLIAVQRRNMEAMTAASQLTMEGFQALMKRQVEIVRQNLEQASSMATTLMAEGTPEDKAQKQAELVKGNLDRAVADLKELAEMVQATNHKAAEVVAKRVSESVAELQAAVEKAGAGSA